VGGIPSQYLNPYLVTGILRLDMCRGKDNVATHRDVSQRSSLEFGVLTFEVATQKVSRHSRIHPFHFYDC